MRAAPLDRARAVAAGIAEVARAQVADGALRLAADPVHAPWIVRVLVEAGVDVSEVRPVERSLEDIFLALTGSEGDAHAA